MEIQLSYSHCVSLSVADLSALKLPGLTVGTDSFGSSHKYARSNVKYLFALGRSPTLDTY